MGNKRSGSVGKNFPPIVRDSFRFLEDEYGVPAPDYDAERSTVTYDGAAVRYVVGLDRVEHRISLVVLVGRVGASVEEVVAAVGLEPPPKIRSTATSLRSLEQSVESHAAVVRALHPRLAGPGGADLLRAAQR
ncbi:hypothetical protein AB0I60_14635 [Actinosynnema sp. NPDC050436]|uniref:hypothetical protein n=1 Tax=Actinosynnema sp. NPDC050436 TaxID=3155659 RepID=UPI00340271B8